MGTGSVRGVRRTFMGSPDRPPSIAGNLMIGALGLSIPLAAQTRPERHVGTGQRVPPAGAAGRAAGRTDGPGGRQARAVMALPGWSETTVSDRQQRRSRPPEPRMEARAIGSQPLRGGPVGERRTPLRSLRGGWSWQWLWSRCSLNHSGW